VLLCTHLNVTRGGGGGGVGCNFSLFEGMMCCQYFKLIVCGLWIMTEDMQRNVNVLKCGDECDSLIK